MTALPEGLIHLAGRDAEPLWEEYLRKLDEQHQVEFAMRNMQETIDE